MDRLSAIDNRKLKVPDPVKASIKPLIKEIKIFYGKVKIFLGFYGKL
jgi:hypothetical protein